MKFVEFLRSEAKRLNDTANAFENGDMWVGDSLVSSKDERTEAAVEIRQTANLISQIAERNDHK